MSSPCPICAGYQIRREYEYSDFDGAQVWWCSHCNHGFIAPEPGSAQLDEYYKNVYSQKRRRYFGEEYYAVMERRADAQVRFIQQALSDSDSPTKLRGSKVLDWGCGIGALVALFQRMHVDVVGYDSDVEGIAVGRQRWGANIRAPTSKTLIHLRGQFDLLLLSHVVEHLPKVRETLRTLLATLRPNGLVFIEVPNCSPAMFAPGIDLESHLQFFSQQSLTPLLEGVNAVTLACTSCGPPLGFSLDNSRQDTGRMRSQLRRVGERLGILPTHIKTMYDGFYSYYPREDEGIWLRYLGSIAP